VSHVRDTAPERFEALFRANHRAVVRYAQRRTDPDTAEEVAAETFAIAWRRFHAAPAAEPLPWLLVIARNVLANRRRAAQRAGEKEHRAASEPLAAMTDPAERHAEREAVMRAFAKLSESDREVLRLVAWDGLTAAAAGRVTGVSRLAFSQRFGRARRRLRSALNDLESESEPLPGLIARPEPNEVP
jgi:RNA polymerase sigma-70 factor (ECF subfamily)